MKSLQQASFNPISSSLSLGAAIADISRGWDGTLWAIDANGAPHLYDPLEGVWNPYGAGIDAAALVGNTIYHFRGPEVVECALGTNQASAPTLISEKWPGLPYSFRFGVRGAANVNGTLYLFGRGQYVSVEQPGEVFALDQLKGWPTTGGWAGGAIDGVCALNGDEVVLNGDQVLLFRNGEWITINISESTVVHDPSPLSQYSGFAGTPAQFLGQGFRGGFFFGPDCSLLTIYSGPGLLSFNIDGDVPTSPQYVATAYSNWPKSWNPLLAHAPSGRVGNLWAAMSDGKGVMYHDGDAWNAIDGVATYAAVGSDNSVYTIGEGTALFQWQGGTSWNQVSSPPPGATQTQISVGDSNHIWARDSGNAVYALAGGAFSPSSEVGQAVHLAANYDGSVWHCNNDANAYRYAGSGSASQALSIPQGTVTKVASTGFGTSHCLTTANGGALYEYTSPFAYKSAPDYNLGFNSTGQIAAGDGCIFFLHQEGDINQQAPHFQAYIVATDSQNGQLRWKTPLPWPNCWGSAPTYDPRLNRVYFGMAVANWNDGTSPGAMVALDARTGEVVWYIQQRAESHPGIIPSVDYAPAVSGNLLIFGDRAGYLHAIDTDTAVPNGSMQWSVIGARGQNPGNLRVGTPVIAGGICYFYTWSSGDSAVYVQSCVAADGSALSVPPWRTLDTTPGITPALWPPVLGRANFPTGDGPALFVQAGNITHAVNLSVGPDSGGTNADLNVFLESSNIFMTNLVYLKGTLWVGDIQGQIHALNSTFEHVCSTPQQVVPAGTSIFNISAYQDVSGNTSVFCAAGLVSDKPGTVSLFAFNAANTVVEEILTGTTLIGELGPISNGVLPAAGGNWGTKGEEGTIFGVRVDQVLATQRAFIVESQLMQDYDEPTPGATPTAVARYQTHVTLVDNFKVPRGNETIKIWADKAGTAITVDGTPYTIGPGDASFASVQTGVDGAIVIASDATQLYSASLRLWAGFMDPYERIAVCPDQEFHGRLLNATADSTDTDPARINLTTAQTYTQWKPDGNGGTTPVNTQPLLTGAQPGQVSGAIQKFGGASGVGRAPVSATGHHRFGGRLGAAPPKYSAYDDLPGQGYSPVNVALKRLAQTGVSTGFSFSTESGLVGMSPAQAAAAIDALIGDDWQPAATLGSPHRLGGWWDDFWNWCGKTVETAADAIANIVISVAEDIYVGIQVIVKGIKTVFRAIVHTIEDAAKAIGSFFLKIGKLIENVIQALSLFFHFDKILMVHALLRNAINNGLANSSKYLQNQAKTAVDTVFSTAKDDVTQAFAKWKALVQASQGQSFSTLPTAGGSPHTMLSASPKSGGPKKSCSVHGMWGIHKMKTNLHSASLPTQRARLADPDNPLADFAQTFLDSLKTDPTLKDAYANTIADFKKSFQFTSLSQFATGLLVDLIDILCDIVLAALALGEALINGLLKVAADLINDLTAILNYEIKIPLISSLYQMLTGSPLTLLDLACLILAIPVTFLYVIIDGAYPALGPSLGAVSDKMEVITARVCGLFTAIASLPYTMVSVAADVMAATDNPLKDVLGKIGSAINTVMWVAGAPGFIEEYVEDPHASAWDLAGWAWGVSTPAIWWLSAIPLVDQAGWLLNCISGLAQLAFYIAQKYKDASSEDGAAMTANVSSTLPNIAAPLLAPFIAAETLETSGAVKVLIDLFCGLIAGMATVVETCEAWDTPLRAVAVAAAY